VRDATDNYIYTAWQKCDDHLTKNALYSSTKKCVRFYEGDQWHDEQQPDYKKLPFYNIIKPVIDYKSAMVAKNAMVINYTPLNIERQPELRAVCSELNSYAAELWESLKLDSVLWEVVKKAAVTGESYIYFGTADLTPQIIDRTNVFLADEQEPVLQVQKYIIIRERRFVDDVRKEAKTNGLSDGDISLIQSDEPENQVNNDNNEIASSDNGKVTSLLYLSHNDAGFVTFARATKSVVYQPEQVAGQEIYPIAGFVWGRKMNSARGLGECLPMIPNQLAINRLLLRREVNNKQTGYAHPVYNEDYIKDPATLDRVGAKVAISGNAMVQDVTKAFTYIQPAPMSSDGTVLQNELIDMTRNLANASDSATGSIDPEKASGKAINLVIDQNAVLLTEQNAMYKQFVEDIAVIWYAIWQAYNPNGMLMEWEGDDERTEAMIPGDVLQNLKVRVRIDVSSNNPWSVYANDQEAMNLFGNGYISFEQYVELLSDQNHMKPKLQQMIKEQQAEQAEQAMQQLMGGGQGVMPQMQNAVPNPLG